MAVTVLMSIAVLATACLAREFNCTVDESLCTGNGAQAIVVAGQRMCCPPTATFSLNNNDCKCVVPDTKEEPCREGVPQCRQATSFSTDSQGILRCCLPGLALNMVSKSVVNGMLMDVCTCRSVGNGGFMTSFMGMGHNGPVMAASFPAMAPRPVPVPSTNSTDIRSEWQRISNDWRNWGQNFGQGFRTWGHNFGQSMRGTGLNLARSLSGVLQNTLANTMVPLQRAFTHTIGNAFSAIPGAFPNQPTNPRVLMP
eukprot:GHVL01024766.1.p1 GENE.GHVL01024766.1~~GHVL01024766.1.p1  ORF type:complete len:255 (-),score=9.04 GHVL01024766.1:400-1164(-)